jgi:hypothetical protein
VDAADLMLAAGTTLLIAAAGCLLLGERRRRHEVVIRWILLAVVGGMMAYVLLALPIVRPEVWELLPEMPWASRMVVVGVVAVGALLPLGPLILREQEL